jgi:serine/threonine protein kinase
LALARRFAVDLFPDIPGYRIEQKIADGRISDIFLAVQEDLDRQVAVKVLNPELFKDEKFADNFHKEAKRMSKFTHPNIVNMLDVGEYNGLYYIVMEYLPGSLRELISRKFSGEGNDPRLEDHGLINLLKQVAWSFDYAHKSNVIHKDIRPDNIRFREDGTPVVVGFFISRVIGSSNTLKKLGMIAGTPQYASPEQALRKPLNSTSDLYSLGVTLFEILTGNVPYDAEEIIAIENQHIMEPIPNLPDEFFQYQPLLDALMEKNKEDRVQNAVELLKLLDELEFKLPNKEAIPDPGEQVEIQNIHLSMPEDIEIDPPQDLNEDSSPEDAPVDKKELKKQEKKRKHLEKVSRKREKDEAKRLKKAEKEGFDLSQLSGIISNPRILIPVAAGIVIVVLLFFFIGGGDDANSGDNPSADGKQQGTANASLSKEEQEIVDLKYRYKIKLAKRDFGKGQYQNAMTKVKDAEKFKQTEESKKLKQQITQKLAVQKDHDAYNNALAASSSAAVEMYLKQFPGGLHEKEAQQEIVELKVKEKKEVQRMRQILAASITLRSQYLKIPVEDVKQMLLDRNFFDKYYNKNGNFRNKFELKQDLQSSVILDYATGLMWHQSGSEKYIKFKQVQQWLAQLNQDNYAGFSDWRIPTLEEAASLMEKTENRDGLFIDSRFNREQKYIWTGDTFGSQKIWVVDFFSGDVNRVGYGYEVYVRPVRSLRIPGEIN